METKEIIGKADIVRELLVVDNSIEPEVRQGLINFIDIVVSKISIQDLLLNIKQDSYSPIIAKKYCNRCIFWDNQKIFSYGNCSNENVRKGLKTNKVILNTHEHFGCRHYEGK